MLTLFRYSFNENRVLGLLFKNGSYVCDTLERPWLNNSPFVSCIPEGVYAIDYREDETARIKKGYIVKDVPNRVAILIHAANSVDQLEGCIAVGVKAEDLLYSSRDTLTKLCTFVGSEDVLTITKLSA